MHSMFRKGKSGSGRVRKIDESERIAGQDQDSMLRTEGHCKIPGGPEICQDRADNVSTFRHSAKSLRLKMTWKKNLRQLFICLRPHLLLGFCLEVV